NNHDWCVLRIAIHVAGVQAMIASNSQLSVHICSKDRTARDQNRAPVSASIGRRLEVHVGTRGIVLTSALGRVAHASGAGGVDIASGGVVGPEGIDIATI